MSEIALAVLVALLAFVGLCGVVVPVLPGSLTVAAAALVWALWGTSSWGWIAFAVVLVLVVIGMSASFLLTRRDLGRRQIPQWPIFVALVCGIVGAFVLPALGLPIGFVAGLFCAELVRVQDARTAWSTSLAAMKTIGTGILVELACAMAATTVLGANVVSALI